MLPLRVKHHLTEIPSPGMRSPLWSCCLRFSKWVSKIQHIAVVFCTPQKRRVSPYVWRHQTLQEQDSETPELGLTWSPLSWGTSFHGSKRLHVSFHRRETTNSLTQLWRLMGHIHDQRDTVALYVQWWHTYLGSRQKLSLNLRHAQQGTGNLANPSVLRSCSSRRIYNHHLRKPA